LTALHSLLNPLIAQNDEVIRLRAEVELWRGEWQRCDRERRRLEGVLNAKNSEPIDGPPFSAVILDGDGLIVSDSGRVEYDADFSPSSKTNSFVKASQAASVLRVPWLLAFPASMVESSRLPHTPAALSMQTLPRQDPSVTSVRLSCRFSSTSRVSVTRS
jgi:hypothetical protein